MKQPNILYIMTDQFNADCMGNANPMLITPNLDLLAKQGVKLNRAYCNSPICAPSRISFITGQYPRSHGIMGNDTYELDIENNNTLPAVFRRSGYQTALVGKSHMIKKWDENGFEYIRYCDFCDCDPNEPFNNHYYKYLFDHHLADDFDLGSGRSNYSKGNYSKIPYMHSVEAWTGNTTLDFLQSRDINRPFFLQMSFQRPHEPLSVAADKGLLYDVEKISIPESAKDYFKSGFKSKTDFFKKYAAEPGSGYPYVPLDERDLKRQLAFYYTLITLIDEQIGRVIEALKQSGEFENTIIVFTADHGDFAGQHGLTLKNRGIFEAIHRIPFLIKYPGSPTNFQVDGIVESVDLFPTLCELCNIEVPKCVDGVSFVPVINGENMGKAYSVCEFDFPIYTNRVNAIRTRQYRMVYYGKDQQGELYDTAKDPMELHNLYEEQNYREIRLSLLEMMFDYVDRYKLKLSMADGIAIARSKRNTLVSKIAKQNVQWNELKDFYVQ